MKLIFNDDYIWKLLDPQDSLSYFPLVWASPLQKAETYCFDILEESSTPLYMGLTIAWMAFKEHTF